MSTRTRRPEESQRQDWQYDLRQECARQLRLKAREYRARKKAQAAATAQ